MRTTRLSAWIPAGPDVQCPTFGGRVGPTAPLLATGSGGPRLRQAGNRIQLLYPIKVRRAPNGERRSLAAAVYAALKDAAHQYLNAPSVLI
jgi:hypothetical protein